MTYTITTLTNDNAKLIVATTMTNDKEVMEFTIENARRRGFLTVVRNET